MYTLLRQISANHTNRGQPGITATAHLLPSHRRVVAGVVEANAAQMNMRYTRRDSENIRCWYTISPFSGNVGYVVKHQTQEVPGAAPK